MFCTTCASPNARTATECTCCGARMKPFFAAPAQEMAIGRSRSSILFGRAFSTANHRQGMGTRLLSRVALVILPVVAVLIASTQLVESALARQKALSAAYHRGSVAEASGDYVEAINAYAEAAGYRDATARRVEMVALLAPYQEKYYLGIAALEVGDYLGAIAALTPVVRDLPTFEDASFLLHRARDGRIDNLSGLVVQAKLDADWLAVERALTEWTVVDPGNEVIQEQLAVHQRDHAPLVFARDGSLYLVGPDGRDERLVVEGYSAVWPVWSPDRGRIAFMSTAGPSRVEGGALFVVNGDGSGLTELVLNVRSDVAPAWSPDGSRIAFAASNDEPNSTVISSRSIQYVDLVTGDVVDVTSGRVSNPVSPSWSPTGDRLVFVSRWTGEQIDINAPYPPGRVYIASLSDGSIEALAPERVSGARRVAWAPASDHVLVFSRASNTSMGNESVALFDVQTGVRTFYFSTPIDASLPIWAPDGSRFAFVVDGRVLRIETLHGGSYRFDVGAAGGRSVTWAPNGEAVIVLGSWYGAASTIVPLPDADPGWEKDQITFDFDMDRRFSGAPQWAPVTSEGASLVTTFGGTAIDAAFHDEQRS